MYNSEITKYCERV